MQAGESAGATIAFAPAAVLRSTTALTLILGTAGIPAREVLVDAIEQVPMTRAARGELRMETERVPLAEIESVWGRPESEQKNCHYSMSESGLLPGWPPWKGRLLQAIRRKNRAAGERPRSLRSEMTGVVAGAVNKHAPYNAPLCRGPRYWTWT